MRLFLELTKRSFQRQLSYRAAAIAGLATNFFFGLLRAAVLIGRVSDLFRIRDLEVREPLIEATIRRIYEERLLQ
ncbi:MAG: hypothetical protein FVQ83_16330 [Chloroflexi bacterium]|nr:hypothetical protein [Chloroflexota bacterium]